MKPADTLTRREFQVLALVARGVPHGKIAAQLGISIHTEKQYFTWACDKSGCDTRLAIAAWFLDRWPTREAEDAEVARIAAKARAPKWPRNQLGLTVPQMLVYELIVNDTLGDAEIAARLEKPLTAVRALTKRILQTMGCKNRTEMLFAHRRGRAA